MEKGATIKRDWEKREKQFESFGKGIQVVER